MRIGPGSNVEIVIDFDWFQETIDIRRATVYDVQDEKIILSQTSPPIASYNIGKRVKLTYILKERQGAARYAVNGSLQEIVKEYRLSGSETAEAIVVVAEPGEERFNLRRHYRLEPPADSGITLCLDGEQVSLLDISVGGARFNYRTDRRLGPGEKIKLELRMENQRYEVLAEVVRTMPLSGRMAGKLETAAVQFLDLDENIKEILSKKIRDIERELRYKERFRR